MKLVLNTLALQSYGKKLDQTIAAFNAKNDTLNAARTRTVQQKISTFTWVTTRAGLTDIDTAVSQARKQRKGNKRIIVGLVLYNLPDRDCSAGESAGELSSDKDGLNIYKKEFVDVYAKKVSQAKDVDFAIVLEPDSLGNTVTNMGSSSFALTRRLQMLIFNSQVSRSVPTRHPSMNKVSPMQSPSFNFPM